MQNCDDSDQYDMYDNDPRVSFPEKVQEKPLENEKKAKSEQIHQESEPKIEQNDDDNTEEDENDPKNMAQSSNETDKTISRINNTVDTHGLFGGTNVVRVGPQPPENSDFEAEKQAEKVKIQEPAITTENKNVNNNL